MAPKNAAYDLDIFENRAPRPRPLETEKSQQMVALPKRREKHWTQAQIKANRNLLLRVEVALFSAVFLFLAGFLIYGKVILSETIVQIDTKQVKLKYLLSEQVRLSSELEQQISLKDVEAYAIQKLGMVKVNENQVHYINTNEGDQAVITTNGNEAKLPISERIQNAFTGEEEVSISIGGS